MTTVQLERARRRRRKQRPWQVVLPWLVTALILVATAAIAFWPREPELRDPARPGEEGALVWGDGVFTNPLELEAWLRVRGADYKTWARRHPAAVKLLVPPAEGEVRPARPVATTPAADHTSLASPRSLGILGLLGVLGGALALLAWRLSSRAGRFDIRPGIVGAAASVAIGVAVASFLA